MNHGATNLMQTFGVIHATFHGHEKRKKKSFNHYMFKTGFNFVSRNERKSLINALEINLVFLGEKHMEWIKNTCF